MKSIALVHSYIDWKYIYGPFGAKDMPEAEIREAEQLIALGKSMAWERRVKTHRSWMFTKIPVYAALVFYALQQYSPDISVLAHLGDAAFFGPMMYFIEQALLIEVIGPKWQKLTGG